MTAHFRPDNFTILPTMACQAECSCCTMENTGERMSLAAVYRTAAFIGRVAPAKGAVHIRFHGDPLLAEEKYYETILPMLRERFGRRLRFSLHSKLCALDGRMIRLIKQYEIAVSACIDSGQEISDVQRGEGYYRKTYPAVSRLRNEGVPVEEIRAFTSASSWRAGDVFGYNTSMIAALPYDICCAVPILGASKNDWALDAPEMKRVLLDTLKMYRENAYRRRIGTIDAMAKGCLERKGAACKFEDCLGRFAAIVPDGRIYACERFCNCGEFALGNVFDDPDEAMILKSEAYQKLLYRQNGVMEACGDCLHYDYCKGGCLYNMFTAATDKDPYCEAYRAVFGEISHGMALEMGGLMAGSMTEKETPLLAMAGNTPHPYDLLVDEINMRLALRYASPERGGFLAKHKRKEFPENRYNKLYLHIASGCPDALAGEPLEMDTNMALAATREAAKARFKSVAVIGAEPLAHSGIDRMLDRLSDIDMTGTKLALQTPLRFEIPEPRLQKACETFDEIIVSLNGNWESQDTTLQQLKRIRELGCIGKVIVYAALPKEPDDGSEKIIQLCNETGIKNIRFRPMPLNGLQGERCTDEYNLCEEENGFSRPFEPRFHCGLGQNLYIAPDGSAYPCYALHVKEHLLGSVKDGLPAILQSEGFMEFRWHDVDTNGKCQNCGVRYLCGGLCKAWAKNKQDIDSGDFDCTARKTYFERIAARIEM